MKVEHDENDMVLSLGDDCQEWNQARKVMQPAAAGLSQRC